MVDLVAWWPLVVPAVAALVVVAYLGGLVRGAARERRRLASVVRAIELRSERRR